MALKCRGSCCGVRGIFWHIGASATQGASISPQRQGGWLNVVLDPFMPCLFGVISIPCAVDVKAFACCGAGRGVHAWRWIPYRLGVLSTRLGTGV